MPSAGGDRKVEGLLCELTQDQIVVTIRDEDGKAVAREVRIWVPPPPHRKS